MDRHCTGRFRVSIVYSTHLTVADLVVTFSAFFPQELRVLKNFSSLKAIISGLQSNPIYRLKKAWSYVPRDKLEVFEELARIFSGENNALAQRELLVREGTARFANTVGEHDHHMQKILQKHSENSRVISYGTIPYLGTFLTDLTMIDTAIPDWLPESLINFDKRRKEFEVLAQIKLLQGAANAYHIESDPKFSQWFDSVLLLDEKEAFDLSCKMEPSGGVHGTSTKDQQRVQKKRSNGIYHRKNDSIASTASSSSGSQFYETDCVSTSALATPLKDSFSDDMAHTPDKDEEDGIGFSSPLGAGSHGGSGRWSSAQSSAASNNGGASVDSCSNIVSSEPKPASCPSEKIAKTSRSEGSSNRALSKTSSTSSASLSS